MKDHEYYDFRDDRLLRYPEARRLDQTRWIAITAAPDYLQTYAGQVALLTAANLLGRMSRRVVLDIPANRDGGPSSLGGNRSAGLCAGADAGSRPPRRLPRAPCPRRRPYPAPWRDRRAGRHARHRLACLSRPRLRRRCPSMTLANPVGAALAVIAAAARLAVNGFDGGPQTPLRLNAFDWTHEIGPVPPMPSCPDLGVAMDGRHGLGWHRDPLFPLASDPEVLAGPVRRRQGQAGEHHPLADLRRFRYRRPQSQGNGKPPEDLAAWPI